MNIEDSGGTGDPKSKTVLIVDDDGAILNLLEILVKCDGFQVLLAETGEEAIHKVARKPDAILLDLILPGAASGLEVLRHLRQGGQPVPPVIVITGHDTNHPAVQEAKKDPNVVHFFQKPVQQDKLLFLLHRILRTKAPARKTTVPPAKAEKGAKTKG
jgi:DNA-binding NtrC family response regulator